MSRAEHLIAAELVQGSAVQEAIDLLENLLPPEYRSSVACTVVIVDEPLSQNVMIELKGPAGHLARIRDRVAPGIPVT